MSSQFRFYAFPKFKNFLFFFFCSSSVTQQTLVFLALINDRNVVSKTCRSGWRRVKDHARYYHQRPIGGDEEEKDEAVAKLGRGHEITRFKGLGEISPNEFGQFIGDDMRIIQVNIEKMSDIPHVLDFFMGSNTGDRKQFIMDNLA